MGSFSSKKLLLLGIIAVIAAAIPATLYLINRQQQSQVGATAATTVSFDPPTVSTTIGGQTILNVMVDPGNTNQVSFVKLRINYDSCKLKVVDNGLVPTNALPSVLEEATINPGAACKGTANLTVSAGADPTKIITKSTKIATLTFQGLANTAPTTSVTFDQTTMQILSAGADATSSENVLSSVNPAVITVGGANGTGTPAPSGGGTIAPTTSTQPTTPLTTLAPTVANQAPVCTALGLDRAASGTAPYSITFTASGTDQDNAITKASFNFGDGPVQDVTTGGNLGTKTVSVQTAHTYVNAGTYSVTAVLTDASGATSTSTTCTQTVTVLAGTTTGSTVPIVTIAQSPQAPVITQAQAPAPTVAALPKRPVSGPGDTILTVGAIGAVLSVLGAAIFFIL